MTYTYEIPMDENNNPRTDLIIRSDGAAIPTDPANADYQAYLNKDTLPSNSSTPQV